MIQSSSCLVCIRHNPWESQEFRISFFPYPTFIDFSFLKVADLGTLFLHLICIRFNIIFPHSILTYIFCYYLEQWVFFDKPRFKLHPLAEGLLRSKRYDKYWKLCSPCIFQTFNSFRSVYNETAWVEYIEESTNVSSFIKLPLYLFCVLRTIPVLKARFREMSLFLSPLVTAFVSDLLSDQFLPWITK